MTPPLTGPISKRHDSFVETAIDDETVVMSLQSGDFFSLRGSAAAIWELLDGTRDRAAICAQLALEHTAQPDDIARDVDAFLNDLVSAGLIAAG
jgi:hypothetical protein